MAVVAKINLLIFLLIATISFQLVSAEKAVLRQPPANNHGQFLEHLFSNVYELMGYEMEFVEVNRGQEIGLVKSGHLIGALARDGSYNELTPEIIKIDVPLFEYEMFLVADRRVCGYCFNEQLVEVGYSGSGKVFVEMARSFPSHVKKVPITDKQNIQKMLLSGELSAGLVSNIGLGEQLKNNPHFVIRKVSKSKDYHYLSPKFKHLQQDITKILSEHEKMGLLDDLRFEYQINLADDSSVLLPSSAIAVSGNWDGYTETDGSGVYWDILKQSLGKDVELSLKAFAWIRAVRMFKTGQADILYGTYLDGFENYPRSQLHLDYEYEVFAVANDKHLLNDFMSGATGLRICGSSVLASLLRKLDKNNKIYDSERCESLLTGGRVDVMLEYEYNLYDEGLSLPKQVYYPATPIFAVFHNTEKGKALQRQFDKRLAELAKSKRLSTLFPNQQEFQHANIEMNP